MISYTKFKEIFNCIRGRNPEIEFFFNNRDHSYMIIKYSDYVTFQRCGYLQEQSGEIRFETLDELYNAQTIDDIVLKKEWENIDDIIFDAAFSVVRDKEAFYDQYGITI